MAEAMDFFNSSFFSINKKLLSVVGLWPYQNYLQKILIRSFFGLLSLVFYVPHLICLIVSVNEGPNQMMRTVANILYILQISTKMITSIVAEDKIIRMFENIAQNWKILKDEEEIKILLKHSENGRFYTIIYISYIISALIAFITLPMVPLIMDKIVPLNESRPKFLILNGEYLVDQSKHYLKLYIFEGFTCITSVLIIMPVDTTYVLCAQQCIGLMDIVKMRLRLIKRNIQHHEGSKIEEKVTFHTMVVQTVQYHQKAIDFVNVIESTYALYFLFLIGLNVIILSLGCIIILMNMNNLMEIIRFSMLNIALMIHVFYMSWPGQQLIDISFEILKITYSNGWYELDPTTKKMLLFMMMRCKEPCQLTAGGIYVMNMENYGAILKASLSYITVFSSMI